MVTLPQLGSHSWVLEYEGEVWKHPVPYLCLSASILPFPVPFSSILT